MKGGSAVKDRLTITEVAEIVGIDTAPSSSNRSTAPKGETPAERIRRLKANGSNPSSEPETSSKSSKPRPEDAEKGTVKKSSGPENTQFRECRETGRSYARLH